MAYASCLYLIFDHTLCTAIEIQQTILHYLETNTVYTKPILKINAFYSIRVSNLVYNNNRLFSENFIIFIYPYEIQKTNIALINFP